jgi:hypothetical protein
MSCDLKNPRDICQDVLTAGIKKVDKRAGLDANKLKSNE